MDADTKVTMTLDDFDFTDYNYSYSENYNEYISGELVCDQESSMYFDSIFIPVLYFVMLVVGLVGNGLVLVVLWKKRLIMNASDIFILHLSLADIFLLLTLPFWAVQAANEWIFGTALCKLTGALFKINFYCGIFMLCCIIVDGYLSIIHTVETCSRKKQMVTHCCCLMIWIFCLLLSIPDWILLVAIKAFRHQEKTECVAFYPYVSSSLATRLLYHILGFIIPALVMLFCCSCILLRCGTQCKRKKRAVRVIVALVLAFFIHWMPYNIALIIDTIQTNGTNNTNNLTPCKNSTALGVALTVTSTWACLHRCVNPFLCVGLVSRKSFLWSELEDTSNTSAF